MTQGVKPQPVRSASHMIDSLSPSFSSFHPAPLECVLESSGELENCPRVWAPFTYLCWIPGWSPTLLASAWLTPSLCSNLGNEPGDRKISLPLFPTLSFKEIFKKRNTNFKKIFFNETYIYVVE